MSWKEKAVEYAVVGISGVVVMICVTIGILLIAVGLMALVYGGATTAEWMIER